MGLPELKNLDTGIYSGNMKGAFTKAGFQALTESKYLKGYSYLLPGDVLLYEGHHAATNITKGKNVVETSAATTTTTKATGTILVRHGNYYIRTEPNKNAEALGIVKTDETVFYLGETVNGWYKVAFGSQVGWLSAKAGDISEVALTKLTVKKGTWYVRATPSSSGKKLGTVKAGETITSQGEEKDGWLLVEYNNANGWISKRAVE